MTERRQQWTKGAVVMISLGDESFAFGQMLEFPEYAFFDLRRSSDTPLKPEDVVTNSVLFRLWVMARAHSKGRWPKIGLAPIAPELRKKVLRFNQDPLKPSSIFLTYDGVSGSPCAAEECTRYERAAVWDPDHVEDFATILRGVQTNGWSLYA